MLVTDAVLAVQGGGYISPFKILPLLIILYIWARLLTWTDEDSQIAHLPRVPLNIGNMFGMVIAFALFFFLPTFILSFFALLVIMGAEAGVYLQLRNKQVGLADLDKQFKKYLADISGKNRRKKELGAGAITLIGKDGKPLPVPDGESPDRPAYDAVQDTLIAIEKDADQIDLAPEGDAMAVKYTVDTFVHRGPTIDRAIGSAAITYLKWAGGLNIEDRRKPQTSIVKSLFNKNKYELRIQTAGTTAGEFLRVAVNPKTRHTFLLNDLGFTPAQKTLVTDLIKKDKGGIVILSAPKGHGLTSLLYSILRSHDAFLEQSQTLERDQEQDLEGIKQTKLDPSASLEEEAKQVDWIISQQADVFGVSKLENPRSAAMVIDYAKEGKRAYVCVRANSTFEAMEQWKRLVGSGASATEAVKAVINGRVLRKLCMACKEGFTPDPAMLKKLNLSAEKATTLYKAREEPLRDPKGNPIVCEFCHDLRYKGRTGIYETLIVDDEVRQTADANKPLGQAFRKQQGRYLQEEALVLVEKGETSVQEVLRVLKPPSETGEAPAARTAARAPVAKR